MRPETEALTQVQELAGRHTARTDLMSLVLLSLGHFFIDLYSGALGALQPLLVDVYKLSLTQAGMLGGLLVCSSSVLQPAYGYLSDRFRTRLFTVLAPATAGIFISCLGLAPDYVWLLIFVWFGGAGVASFHPQASSWAVRILRKRQAGAMAVFISAGTLGMALGPIFFSQLTGRWGVMELHWAALPGIVMAVVLALMLPSLPGQSSPAKGGFDWRPLKAVWRSMTVLYFLVFIRSILQITFAQLLPLYLHRERGFSVTEANVVLSLYLTSGALGGFVGGYLADRFGERLVILFSMIASVPFLTLFFLGHGAVAIAGLALGGFILLFTIPVNVVMAQRLAPAQAGTVSALMMGFAWGMAGLIFIPLVGWASDIFSLGPVLASLLAFPIGGFLLALKLPK